MRPDDIEAIMDALRNASPDDHLSEIKVHRKDGSTFYLVHATHPNWSGHALRVSGGTGPSGCW